MAHAPQIDGELARKEEKKQNIVGKDKYIYTYNLVLSKI